MATNVKFKRQSRKTKGFILILCKNKELNDFLVLTVVMFSVLSQQHRLATSSVAFFLSPPSEKMARKLAIWSHAFFATRSANRERRETACTLSIRNIQ